MNKFIIFAVLVVCATACSSFNKRFFSIRNHIRGNDGYIFQPHDLPCAFQINAKSTASLLETGQLIGETGATFTRHGDYFRAFAKYKEYDVEKIDEDTVVRPDLKVDKNGTVYIKKFEAEYKDADSCKFEWQTEDEIKEYIDQTLEIFYNEEGFDELSTGEYEGKKYLVYSSVESNTSFVKYYTDDDFIYVLEEVFQYNDTFNVHNVVVIDYNFNVPLDTFVISKDVSSKCDEDAYKAPTEKTCPDQVYFKPAALPCAFKVCMNMTGKIVETGEVTEETNAFVAGHQTYFSIYQDFVEENESMFAVIRSDIKKDGKYAVFGGDTKEGMCEEYDMTKEEADSYSTMLLQAFTTCKFFEKKEKGQFQGQDCDVYSSQEGEEYMKYYVNGRNYIIGTEQAGIDPGNEDPSSSSSSSSSGTLTLFTSILSYDFNPSLNVFAVPDIFQQKCSDEAYKAPTQVLCPDSSSSHKGSMASTTKASIAMTLLSVVSIALLL